jgi:hypothetical protein
MMLRFPNDSRCFDDVRNRVRFWGYDGAVEITFFVDGRALQKIYPEICSTETGFLRAFDAERNRIYDVADKVYQNNRKGSFTCTLAAGDF